MFGRRRKSELEHFQRNAAGELVYTGALYSFQGPGARKGQLGRLWALGGAAFLLILAAGLTPAPGQRGYWYVTLPYAGALVLAMAALWSLGRISLAGDPIRQYVYEGSCQKFSPLFWCAGLLSGAAGLGQIAYLLLHGGGDRLLPGIAYALMLLAGGAAGCLSGKRSGALRWEKQ